MNREYIRRQRDRYNQYQDRSSKLDCLYRLASHANLITLDEQHQIDQVGWTKDLEIRVLRWINANEATINQDQSLEVG